MHRPRAVGTISLALNVLAATCLSVPAVGQAPPSVRPEAGSAPLLEALAYVPAQAPVGDPPPSIGFVDWEGRAGALDPVDASVLDVVAPTGWPLDWGWDRSDLEWELHAGPTTVLRFEDGSDSDGLQAEAIRRGLVRETAGDADGGSGDVVYRLPTADGLGITVTDGGRTVIVEQGGTGEATAARARERDALEVAAGPYGRVAASLGRPLVARLYPGHSLCTGTGAENALLRGADARVAASAGRMHPYEVLGVAYSGTEGNGGVLGQYVLEYGRARQAEADLAGRRALARQSFSSGGGVGDEGLHFVDAAVSGQQVVVDVASAGDGSPGQASELFDRLAPGPGGEPALLAICGPAPSGEPLARQATPDHPIFVGPASLALSGGAGIQQWDEARFGADEIRLKATFRAGIDPCALWLTASDQASPGTSVASQAFTAAPGSGASESLTLHVDYATASMRVETSCDRWSLRLEPLKDPELTLALRERTYPVRGRTTAEIAPQLDQAQGGWAAYASWETDWRYLWQEDVGSCTVTSGGASLASTITYPRWDPPADADPSAVAEWRRFMDSLTAHELGHITIALQGADAIDEVLDSGISAPTCQEVERAADRAALRVHDRHERLNARYDHETDHGRTQGSALR
jgi:predicted secreted Zn-dependent protease